MKNIKMNPYLIAFYAVLIKSLVFTLGGWEFGIMVSLLVKLGFDAFLATTVSKEDTAPLEAKIKALSDKVIQVDNLAKSLNFRK